MQKNNGKRLTESEFRALQPGDKYVVAEGKRTFQRFCKKFAKSGVLQAVNTDNKLNNLRDMFWPEGQTKSSGCVKTTKENGQMNMTKGSGFVCDTLAMVQDDVVSASWRTAAKQTLLAARMPLAVFLDKQKLPKGIVGVVLGQLDTEHGQAGLALALGNAMAFVPAFANDAKLSRLAKELRVMGYEVFTSKLASAVLNPIREGLVEIVKSLVV